MNIHEPILKLAHFYANELNDALTINILESKKLENEVEAQHLLDFCDKMFDLAISYESENKQVLNTSAKVYDAEKVYSVLNDLVTAEGYDHLIED